MPHPLDFLDAECRIYQLHKEAWARQERRAFGNVAAELLPFLGESDARLALRQSRATYVNFMTAHASAVTGHLRSQGAPAAGSQDFSLGSLGVIRPTEQVREWDADYGETIYYNVDAAGGDGSEWPVFFDSVDERAQHTGHRLLLIETPPRGIIRPVASPVQEPEITIRDFRAGIRPYAIELSPLEAPMFVIRSGRWEFVILRVVTDLGRVVDGAWQEAADSTDATSEGLLRGRGYYLLVRRGCELLGPAYARGGYWLYRPDKTLIRTGLWGRRMRGEIPLWPHYGEKAIGTIEEPAMSRSATDGLGRVGVSLMDMLSARDWDAFDAAASRKWFLNANKDVMLDIAEQWEARSMNIGVPPAFDVNTGQSQPVTIYDDSAGAISPAVFQAIIDGKFVEAREQSFQAITSVPGSSGWSKEAGFMEVKAPYLARRASLRQQSEQTGIRFFEQRAGFEPRGFCKYRRQYTLEPLVEDVERAFELLRRNNLSAPSIEPEMALRGIKDRLGSLPMPPVEAGVDPVTEAQVRAELRTSVDEAARGRQQAAALADTFGGGVP